MGKGKKTTTAVKGKKAAGSVLPTVNEEMSSGTGVETNIEERYQTNFVVRMNGKDVHAPVYFDASFTVNPDDGEEHVEDNEAISEIYSGIVKGKLRELCDGYPAATMREVGKLVQKGQKANELFEALYSENEGSKDMKFLDRKKNCKSNIADTLYQWSSAKDNGISVVFDIDMLLANMGDDALNEIIAPMRDEHVIV
jgi:hypothetical protein